GPYRHFQGGKRDGMGPYVSQAPRAVRSAGGGRWDGMFPSSARANGTLYADEGDALGLSVHVHRPRYISTTAASRAVVRTHSFPLSVELDFAYSLTRSCRNRFLVTKREQIYIQEKLYCIWTGPVGRRG